MIGRHLSESEKRAWAKVVTLCRGEKHWFGLSLSLTLASTFLDIGALSLFGVAVSVLVGDTASLLEIAPDGVGELFSSAVESYGNRWIFFILICAAVGIQLIKSSLVYGNIVVDALLRANIQKKQIAAVTRQVINAPIGVIGRYSVGTFAALGEQLNGYVRLCRVVQESASCVITLIVYFGASVILRPELAAVIGGFGLIVWFVSSFISVRIRKSRQIVTEAQLSLSKTVIEYYGATKLLQLYSLTQMAIDEINKRAASVIDRGTKIAIRSSIMTPALEGLVAILVGGILALLAISERENSGHITEVFVVVLLFFRMKPYLTQLGTQKIKIANNLPLASAVETFVRRATPVIADSGTNSKNNAKKVEFKQLSSGIRFTNVSFSYEPSVNVLSNINLEIHRNQVVGIVGASGSGKSTLLGIISGLLEPQYGMVQVDGIDLKEIDSEDWRRHLGIVDPDLPLLNGTISDNIRLGLLEATGEQVRNAAVLAGAGEFIDELPGGYDTVIGDRGSNLSIGQRQRLVLARAFVRDPKLLILDEGTSGLDPESEIKILKSIYEYKHRGTVLLVTHRLSSIQHADHVFVLSGGRVVENGTVTKLLDRDGQFAKAWNAQLEK